jgi:signal transduction histidine kinase
MIGTGSQLIWAGWPLVGLLASALIGGHLRAVRKRDALNRAIHELRRPLQLLSFGAGARRIAPTSSPLELALAALGQLDREVNGGASPPSRSVTIRALADAAVRRWSGRVSRDGGSIALRWRAGDAAVIADPVRIEQALDNLIANAVDHGGPRVLIDARAIGSRLRISVRDEGPGPVRNRERAGRHGYGLEVVRSVAAAHRGRFALRSSQTGSVAILELPLAGSGAALAA